MASTYSTNLALELIGTGDQSGTWGTTTNTNLGTLIEQAISGYVTQAITDGADTTITIPNGATGVARNMFLELTGTLTAARNLIVPTNKKLYFIYNNTTGGYAVTVKVSGQTGVSVPNGKKMVLVSNGTDVVAAVNYFSALSAGGVTVDGSTVQTNGMYLPTTNTLAWSTNSSERMRLDSSGNLGLGVTPYPNSLGKSIDLVNNGGLFSYNNIFYLTSNVYFDGGAWIYKTTNSATMYAFGNGSHNWYVAGSGTAGNSISWTNTMVSDSSGNLGIGMTPSAWVGSWKAVQGQGSGGVFAVASGGNGMYVMGNSYYNGSGLPIYTSSSYATMYQQVNGTHAFYTAASGTAGNTITFTQALTLDANGNLLVNKTSYGGTATGIDLGKDGTITSYSSASTAAASSLQMYSNGASAYRFYVNWAGTINATSTTITAISDQRLKENIQDIDVGLDSIMALKPRKFDWKDGKGKNIKGDRGWIAQEFEQVFPEMIQEWLDPAPEGEEPYKAVNADLIPVLVKAIQEQQSIINDLRSRVAQLETK